MTIKIFNSKTDLSKGLLKLVSKIEQEAIQRVGKFTIAFSGGSLPELFSLKLDENSFFYEKWFVFFVDERFVDCFHEDNNFFKCNQLIFSKTKIPSSQIFPVNTLKNLTFAADDYNAKLSQVFGHDNFPSFDLILLGMGIDGHTASLFPQHRLLHEDQKCVETLNDSPKPPSCRITLTLKVLNNAKNCVFVCTGEEKSKILHHILEENNSLKYPAGMVTSSKLFWYLDQSAAKDLNSCSNKSDY